MRTYEVTFTLARGLPPIVGEAVEIQLDGKKAWTSEQVIVLRADNEVEALERARPRQRPWTKLVGERVELANRWTVSGQEHDARHDPLLYHNGRTYATKREAREDARFAGDVRDRLTPATK